LHSDPVLLSSQVASAAGGASVTVTIPATTVAGSHTITVLGGTSGLQASAALTVLAAAGSGASGSLASTGIDLGPLFALALALLAIGAGVIVMARRLREQ